MTDKDVTVIVLRIEYSIYSPSFIDARKWMKPYATEDFVLLIIDSIFNDDDNRFNEIITLFSNILSHNLIRRQLSGVVFHIFCPRKKKEWIEDDNQKPKQTKSVYCTVKCSIWSRESQFKITHLSLELTEANLENKFLIIEWSHKDRCCCCFLCVCVLLKKRKSAHITCLAYRQVFL